LALIGNYSVFNKTAGRFIAGPTIAQTRANFSKSGSLKNSNLHFGKLASYPSGYGAPYSWSMANAIGAMSSFTASRSAVSTTGNLAGGYNLEGTSTLSLISINAQLDQIVTLVCSALISIASTNANLSASVNLDATGNLSVTSSADIGAIVNALATGNFSLASTAIISAIGHMEAEAGGATPLSPEGLAAAVWGATIAGNTEASTMGSLLLASGGGSSPEVIAAAVWDELLTSHTVTGTYGERIQKLLTLSKFLGLK